MRVLIIGASSEHSIGYQVGKYLEERKWICLVQCASRTGGVGKLAATCNVTDPDHIYARCVQFRPHAIIHAAGALIPSSGEKADEFVRLEARRQLLLAKSLGAYNVISVACGFDTVKHVIFLGGREVSSNEEFAAYTIGNGAMWAAARYAHVHYAQQFATYYLDLPLVRNSTMAHQLCYDGERRAIPSTAISMRKVSQTVHRIIRRSAYPAGSRIVLGDGWTE